MDEHLSDGDPVQRPRLHGVPRWPAALALLGIGGMYLFISDRLTLGPSWLLLIVVVILLVPLVLARRRGMGGATRRLGLAAIGAVTVMVVASAVILVTQLAGGGVSAPTLLEGAALIWVANLLTFAIWYWEIDGGGPARRHRDHHACTDFLFPQMAADTKTATDWSPGFVDYIFLAFNTSTAFSPTDTMVLSRRAKVLMMTQSLVSLVVIAVLAARAINTL